MSRSLCFVFFVLITLLCGVDVALAQPNDWPEYPKDPASLHEIDRGPGNYLSWIKIALLLGMYYLWVKTTDWVNRDAQILQLPYYIWNLVIFVPFFFGLLLALTIPVFPAGMGLLVLAYFGPLIAYIVKRNSIVEMHERVMTPSHIRHLVAQRLQKSGFDVGSEGKEAHEKGAPVVFHAMGGTDKKNEANIIHARQSPGYITAKELVAELVRQRADKCMLDFTRDAVGLKFQIDGVWHDSEPQDRESGDIMLAVFKRMSNLNVDERRKRQVGRFKSEFEDKVYPSTLISQGTQTGERVIVQIERPQSDFDSLDSLGMREKMQERLREYLNAPNGMVLFSSAPAGGLSTTLAMALKLTDRYMRDFVAFQDEASPEALVENIELTTFSSKSGDSPDKMLETLLRREPNALVVNELPNAACATILCDQARDDKLVITSVRAKEAVEALLRVLLLKIPATTFAPAVIAVLNQRLIRRLCEECKQEYEPSPDLLKKLGIPGGRVDVLYRTPDPSEQDKVCTNCNGIGYFGRTSIYELLVVDDKIRQVLEKQPKLDVLRKVARQSGNRNLQQEGIVLVAQGITSVQELSRVLKQ